MEIRCNSTCTTDNVIVLVGYNSPLPTVLLWEGERTMLGYKMSVCYPLDIKGCELVFLPYPVARCLLSCPLDIQVGYTGM